MICDQLSILVNTKHEKNPVYFLVLNTKQFTFKAKCSSAATKTSFGSFCLIFAPFQTPSFLQSKSFVAFVQLLATFCVQ